MELTTQFRIAAGLCETSEDGFNSLHIQIKIKKTVHFLNSVSNIDINNNYVTIQYTVY